MEHHLKYWQALSLVLLSLSMTAFGNKVRTFDLLSFFCSFGNFVMCTNFALGYGLGAQNTETKDTIVRQFGM